MISSKFSGLGNDPRACLKLNTFLVFLVNLPPQSGERAVGPFLLACTPCICRAVSQVGGQSDSQTVSESVSQSGSQSVSQAVSQSVSQSVRQSVSQAVNQSVSQSVSQAVNQSVSQSGRQSVLVTLL
jgi:predicted DNA repair protein MutK